jgi:EmrB/QacA subfamily drug resistance transporter
MGQLDASIVSLALPTLKAHFHATLGAVQWVGLSYLLVLVALLPAIGRFADMFGRKLLYMYGILVFVTGSALCGFAPTLWALDAFRAVQAVGAAMMQANSVAIIAATVPREKLGRAIGIQGAAQAAGLSLGPAVGGLLIAAAGWRLIFLANLPVGIIGVVAARYLIPRSRDLGERLSFDWLGLALFVPPAAALMVTISYGNQLGWDSVTVVTGLAFTVSLGAAFVQRERRASAPMIDPRLFARRAISIGITAGLLAYVVLFGVLFITPFFLEGAGRASSGETGLILTALPIALATVAPASGRAVGAYGVRRLTAGGMAITVGGLISLALLHSSAGLVAAWLAVVGAGLGLFIPANNASIMGASPLEQAGSSSGVLNMTRSLGASLGLSLTALVFALGGLRHGGVVTGGFADAVMFLAAISAAAGLVSLARTRSS